MDRINDNRDMAEMERMYVAEIKALREELKAARRILEFLGKEEEPDELRYG